jgi:hypothetical protein
MPEFALYAENNCVAPDQLAFIAAAIDLQMRLDVAPAWGGESWACVALASLDGIKPNLTRKVLTFKTSLGVDGALGFHTDDDGVEYAEALPPAAPGSGAAIDGTTASHEVIETFGDPSCDMHLRGPSGRSLAKELADPVEADGYPLSITLGPETRQVMVSNFVLPAWFSGGAGPYDFLKRLSGAETMTTGGYFQYLDDQGRPQQIFADEAAYQSWLGKLSHAGSRVRARASVRGAARTLAV